MANTAEKKNIFKRIGGFFVNLVKGIGRKFKEMYFELKKVTWPTKKDMINYSIVVLVFIVIMGVIIGVIDLGAGKLVELLVS
ncbi:MAG TPA: preprotein translocase subunit SecE [Candidatus Pullichristensenella stercorigallinarum]|uniref:Protein translocase subunit SecE n=1 Tax=Candidatus Pullichristensenella stercorigallinarum TaxID=2840909 RepID=A0A9D1CVY6_9FIRM|nr:preprotein translocase subunit SecE [Candidatus Pullichristensenella stercorigallinarum]